MKGTFPVPSDRDLNKSCVTAPGTHITLEAAIIVTWKAVKLIPYLCREGNNDFIDGSQC